MPRRPRPLLARLASALILALSACVLSAATVQAEDRYTFNAADKVYQDTLNQKYFSWDAKLTMFALMGDPVLSARFRYRFNSPTTVPLPALDGTHTYFQAQLTDIPEEYRTGFQAYDIKVVFRLHTTSGYTQGYKVVVDIGDPGKADGQAWSFNIPESSDWDHFLMRDNAQQQDYVSAEEAKKVFAGGLELWDAQIVSIKYTAFDLQEWYRGATSWPKLRSTIAAYNVLAEGVERSTGYKVPRKPQVEPDSMKSSVPYDDRGTQARRLAEAERDLNKLMRLPARFMPPENRKPYDDARSYVPEFMVYPQMLVDDWTSGDQDPALLPKGCPAGEAQAKYKFAKIDGERWVTDLQGNKVMELDGSQVLLGQAYVLDGEYHYSKETCVAENLVELRILNPANGAVLASLSTPCQDPKKRFRFAEVLIHDLEGKTRDPWEHRDTDEGSVDYVELKGFNVDGEVIRRWNHSCGAENVIVRGQAHVREISFPDLQVGDFGLREAQGKTIEDTGCELGPAFIQTTR